VDVIVEKLELTPLLPGAAGVGVPAVAAPPPPTTIPYTPPSTDKQEAVL
jgi:hypothetical protein|tara:strand:- start:26 stop:172 length:147 start_codon:yes stop_codon:yes gene_type:complete